MCVSFTLSFSEFAVISAVTYLWNIFLILIQLFGISGSDWFLSIATKNIMWTAFEKKKLRSKSKLSIRSHSVNITHKSPRRGNSRRAEQCWAVRRWGREIPNTKVFEEPEDDSSASKFGSVHVRACVCVCACWRCQVNILYLLNADLLGKRILVSAGWLSTSGPGRESFICLGIEKQSHLIKEDVNFTARVCLLKRKNVRFCNTELQSISLSSPPNALFGVLTHLTREKRGFTSPAQQASSGLWFQPVWKCHISDPHLTCLKQCAIIEFALYGLYCYSAGRLQSAPSHYCPYKPTGLASTKEWLSDKGKEMGRSCPWEPLPWLLQPRWGQQRWCHHG